MKLLVTGANGFLGRYVVASALRRGHEVRAVVRPSSDASGFGWSDHPGVEIARADLRSPTGLAEITGGVDAVMHLAAVKAGDIHAQLGGTVAATENLLEAMAGSGTGRLVVTSTFSVYEYLRRPQLSLIDEDAPLFAVWEDRDEYAQSKRLQEELTLRRAAELGLDCTVLRPGVIWGRELLWTARIGMTIGEGLWILTGWGAQLPLTYVENCADALVAAAETPRPPHAIYNVVDDELPTQYRYADELRYRMDGAPHLLPVPWIVVKGLARLASVTNRVLFKGRAKVPGILVPAKIHARCRPMRYTNRRIRRELLWRPRYRLAEAMDRAFGGEDLLSEHEEKGTGDGRP